MRLCLFQGRLFELSLADGSVIAAVGCGTVPLRWVPLREGKKRQATVAIQAEPSLHLPGFLHPHQAQGSSCAGLSIHRGLLSQC
jgi:hypothetical protein